MAKGDNVVKAVPEGAQAPEVRYLSDKKRSVTISLQEPFAIGDTEYRELTAHRLTGKDIFALQRSIEAGADAGIAMIAGMCRVPPIVIASLDAVDFAAVGTLAQDFMPQSVLTAFAPTGGNGPSTPQT
jgi:hypothetical protein